MWVQLLLAAHMSCVEITSPHPAKGRWTPPLWQQQTPDTAITFSFVFSARPKWIWAWPWSPDLIMCMPSLRPHLLRTLSLCLFHTHTYTQGTWALTLHLISAHILWRVKFGTKSDARHTDACLPGMRTWSVTAHSSRSNLPAVTPSFKCNSKFYWS